MAQPQADTPNLADFLCNVFVPEGRQRDWPELLASLRLLDVDKLRLVLDTLHVTNAYHHKNSGRVKHEFAVFALGILADSGFVRTDRAVGKVSGRSTPLGSVSTLSVDQAANQPGQQVGGSQHLSAASSAGSHPLANDTFTIYGARSRLLPSLSKLDIPPYIISPPVRIYHICAALAVIQDKSPNYKVLSQQCYWHAGVMLGLVTGHVPSRTDGFSPPTTPAGQLGLLPLVSEKDISDSVQQLQQHYIQKVAEVRVELEQLLAQKIQAAESLASAVTITAQAATIISDAEAQAATIKSEAAKMLAKAKAKAKEANVEAMVAEAVAKAMEKLQLTVPESPAQTAAQPQAQ